MENTYKKAGVDVEEGQRAIKLMKKSVESTFTKNVLNNLGGFGGLFELDLKGIETPVLVSGTDGVGTKLKIAFLMDEHSSIGQDCVAMCVNDVLCQGAKPLFFLDYLATGKLEAEKVQSIVEGIAGACKLSNASLIGGETAEMPGFYSEGEYDLAGFVVGIVDKAKIITGDNVNEGNKLIAISSSGVHSNGFSLVRKVLLEENNISLDKYIDSLGKTLGESLIEPTKIYVDPIMNILDAGVIPRGISHITGGGFYENIPRMYNNKFTAKINRNNIKVLDIFKFIKEEGNISLEEMYKTFNMGVGMVLAVDCEDEKKVLDIINASGHTGYTIGEVIKKESDDIVWED